MDQENTAANTMDTATFGAGCYWCVEAIFQSLKGVQTVEAGFMGGHVDNPSYYEVCQGTTGHAEVCRIIYDPEVITYDELLEVFWQTHDPTTLNQQGADVGTQYRSAVFYHNDSQKELAEGYKADLDASGAWADPIVTEITEAGTFYMAKEDHQDYYNNNLDQFYCKMVIAPKLEKFQKVYTDKLK